MVNRGGCHGVARELGGEEKKGGAGRGASDGWGARARGAPLPAVEAEQGAPGTREEQGGAARARRLGRYRGEEDRFAICPLELLNSSQIGPFQYWLH